ncbi:MAG: hypothetical protein AAGA60_16025 [Cyanobacteria bacterium P01_E01_bin.42]
MSRGARIAIAIAALLCSSIFLMTALDPDSGFPASPSVFYGLAAFCVIIAIACVFPKSHPITLRIIGTMIFLAYAVYVVDSFNTDNLPRALMGFIVWGLPSGYLALMGKFPDWGAGSQAFNPKQDEEKPKKK